MIKIIEKKHCCACGACIQKCPKKCISLLPDEKGFLYPTVNKNKCIDCGICEKVCPFLNAYEQKKPIKYIGANCKDEAIRTASSSGGAFTVFAESVIKSGGVVFGARFDKYWQVVIDYTETIEGLAAFRGSKYVQGRTENTFHQCEAFLNEGKKVLYTGTPCQIAGLNHYLNKTYDNLITCDFVCHGVPSPKVWDNYLHKVIKTFKSANKIEAIKADYEYIKSISFRNKDDGWMHFNLLIDLYDTDSNTKGQVKELHKTNSYMKCFLKNLSIRESCSLCKSKEGRSLSDFTIADYWSSNQYAMDLFDDKGTSLIIINTQKGLNFFQESLFVCSETDAEKASVRNPGLKSETILHPAREEFFDKLLNKKIDIDILSHKILKQTIKDRIQRKIKSLLSFFNY